MLAQLVEQRIDLITQWSEFQPFKLGVAGSTPAGVTIMSNKLKKAICGDCGKQHKIGLRANPARTRCEGCREAKERNVTKTRNEYMRNYMLKRYHKLRHEIVEFLGGVCIKCGSDENLEIDHIKPNSKKFSIGDYWSVASNKLEAELAKCQLLCKACHLKKTKKDLRSQAKDRAGPIVHGNRGYWRGCRCTSCIKANKKYRSTHR